MHATDAPKGAFRTLNALKAPFRATAVAWVGRA